MDKQNVKDKHIINKMLNVLFYINFRENIFLFVRIILRAIMKIGICEYNYAIEIFLENTHFPFLHLLASNPEPVSPIDSHGLFSSQFESGTHIP